jgi:hypothetical protein
MVLTSADRAHFYFCCDDIPLEEFSAYQTALIEKLGTDPAIKDLPRVMRLAGTLHLKDPKHPQKVTLKTPRQPRRYKIGELSATLGLKPAPPAAAQQKITPKVISICAPSGSVIAKFQTRTSLEVARCRSHAKGRL